MITYQHYGNIFGTIGGPTGRGRRIVANQSGAPQTRRRDGPASQIDKLMGVAGFTANVVNSGWTEAQFAQYPQAYRRRLHRIDHGVAAPRRAIRQGARRGALRLARQCLACGVVRPADADEEPDRAGRGADRLPDMHVALAGVGPETETLVAFARQRGVADRLHLVGEVPPAADFRFPGGGRCLCFRVDERDVRAGGCVEAAIAGLPVVANDIAVMREVLATPTANWPMFVENAGGMAEARCRRVMAGPGLCAAAVG